MGGEDGQSLALMGREFQFCKIKEMEICYATIQMYFTLLNIHFKTVDFVTFCSMINISSVGPWLLTQASKTPGISRHTGESFQIYFMWIKPSLC